MKEYTLRVINGGKSTDYTIEAEKLSIGKKHYHFYNSDGTDVAYTPINKTLIMKIKDKQS